VEERGGGAKAEVKEEDHMAAADDQGVLVVVGSVGWKDRVGMAGFVEVTRVAVDWEVEGMAEVGWAWEVMAEATLEQVGMAEASRGVVVLEAVAVAKAVRARVGLEEVG
jgi:hypothetical protein